MKRCTLQAIWKNSVRTQVIIGLAIVGVLLLSPGVTPADQSVTVPVVSQPSATLLDEILTRGSIRIGTTGDYKPFTYLNPETNQFEGIDIDLANNLGKALGVEVQFVKTSWPTLLQDFQAGKYDLGMGGISVNLERQKVALFSMPYLKDGKTPITLKENREKFQTLEQIDQEGVRIIVNPGGTNEKFVRANIRKATIVMHEDNVTIFDQIVQGNADLMITDAVETILQQKLHPELAAIHPEQPFTYSEKAYLMPRDMIFKHFIDQWLHLLQMDGSYQQIYDQWMK